MDYIQRAKNFRTKKTLGQNFLVDENVIEFIVDNANLSKEDTVLEIGPGIGFVTEQIAPLVKKLYAVEIDKDAINKLNKLELDNLEIIEQDILKTDISSFANGEKIKIVANIPYYITSPILAHLLGEIDDEFNKNRKSVSEIILMVQYEVAKRITADSDSKNKEYGSLSVLTNFYSKCEFLKKVNAKSFYPRPKVESAIVKITPQDEEIYAVSDKKLLRRIVSSAFQYRRKTFKNALLMNGFSKDKVDLIFNTLKFDVNIRGEKLSIDDFCKVADTLSQN